MRARSDDSCVIRFCLHVVALREDSVLALTPPPPAPRARPPMPLCSTPGYQNKVGHCSSSKLRRRERLLRTTRVPSEWSWLASDGVDYDFVFLSIVKRERLLQAGCPHIGPRSHFFFLLDKGESGTYRRRVVKSLGVGCYFIGPPFSKSRFD